MLNTDEELNKINSNNEEQNNNNNNKKKDFGILKNFHSDKNLNSILKQSEEIIIENNNNNIKNFSNRKNRINNSKRSSKKSSISEKNNNEDSFFNRNNQSVRVLQKPKDLDTTNFKLFPLWFGLLCALINLVLPGIGTIIGIIKMNDRATKKSFAFSGICQFFTTFFIVGWFYALCNSFLYIFAGYYGKSFEEYMLSDG
jgi:hypothetical protein